MRLDDEAHQTDHFGPQNLSLAGHSYLLAAAPPEGPDKLIVRKVAGTALAICPAEIQKRGL